MVLPHPETASSSPSEAASGAGPDSSILVEAAGGGPSSFSSAAGAGAATACCTGSAPADSATTGDRRLDQPLTVPLRLVVPMHRWRQYAVQLGVGGGHIGTGLLDRRGCSGRRSRGRRDLGRGLGRGRIVGLGPIGGGSSTSLTAAAPDAPSGSLTEYCSSGEVDLLRPRRRPSTIVSSIGQDSRCSSSPAPKIRSSLSTKCFTWNLQPRLPLHPRDGVLSTSWP